MLRNLAKAAFVFVNRLLGQVGLRLVRASAPPRGVSAFFEHAKRLGFDPSLVIDVGVADGTMELYQAFPKAKYLLVEPNPAFEPTLRQICSKLDGDYVIAAAAEEEGVSLFNDHDDLFGSSLLDEVEGALADGKKREVKTVRLDRLIPDEVEGPILLKVDVQGAELQVVGGAEKRLEDIGMIVLEVALISSMKSGPELWDIIDSMKKRNFAVYDILGGVLRPLDGALKQIDLVFVPEDSPLRQDRRYATPEQRRRLNEQARQRWRGIARPAR
ncbi:MAG: FkbM family methyltransferase [Kiloniellales bacterium]